MAAAHAHPAPKEQPGLGCLAGLSCVLVRQKTTAFTGNKYVVTSPGGAELLYAREEAGFSLLAGKTRSFNIDLLDAHHRPVVHLRRPYTFGPDKMDVTVCGALASVVRQEQTFFKPVLNINDRHDRPMLRVKGPVVTSGEADFDIFTRDKRQVGVISKVWSGALREMFTDSDSYRIRFPADMDERYKAAIIGTCFLIDFLYYEN